MSSVVLICGPQFSLCATDSVEHFVLKLVCFKLKVPHRTFLDLFFFPRSCVLNLQFTQFDQLASCSDVRFDFLFFFHLSAPHPSDLT